MIHLAPSEALSPLERFALEVLVDQARLLQVLDPRANVVTVRVMDGDHRARSLQEFAARGWNFQVGDGTVGIPRTLLAEVGSVVSVLSEQVSDAADRFQRVPSSANAMFAGGSAREPLASRCAGALRDAVIAAAQRRTFAVLQPWPNQRRWAVALSHDLDVVDWWMAFTALRLAELARKAQWKLLARAMLAAPPALFSNPVIRAVHRLLATERQAGVRSTWFALCGEPSVRSASRGDITYRLRATRARIILAAVREGGHEIGLHGSFETMLSPQALKRQREELESIIGRQAPGVRQHYLRMRPGATQRAMKEAGFSYDATFGFPDCSGFRLGLADIVPWWDAQQGRADAFDVVPLVWMDRTMSKYQGIEDPQRWVEDALQLATVCAEVEGLWVGLWHPNLAPALGYPGAEEAYAALLPRLIELQPHVAPIEELVSWRRLRRSCHAATIDAAGRPIPGHGLLHDALPALEDQHARPLDWGDREPEVRSTMAKP